MPENPQEPREYDAVLGGNYPPLPDAAVLGGIEGVKRRLASKVVEVRVAALRDALNYGDAGLNLVIEALDDDSTLVEDAAVELLRTSKKNKAKLALLTNLLKIQPQNAHDYDKRGLMRQQLGDLEGAIADFSQAISLFSYNIAKYLTNRGLCHQQLGDLQKAIADFSKAIEYDDEYADAFLNRGICLQSLGNYEWAASNYLDAIIINPNSVIAYYNSGFCWYELEQYQYAIHDYSNAIEIDPTYPDAYMGRARTNTTLGNYQEAIEDYDFIIEGNFNKRLKAPAYHNRGSIYDTLENYQQAIDDASECIALNHGNLKGTYDNRAISRYKLGDLQGAIADFSQVIAIDSNHYHAYNTRGAV